MFAIASINLQECNYDYCRIFYAAFLVVAITILALFRYRQTRSADPYERMEDYDDEPAFGMPCHDADSLS